MELQAVFLSKHSLNEKSITSYKNLYRRLINTGKFDYEINNTANKKIITIINEMTCSSNSKQSLLNIAIIIKQVLNKDIELLVKQREKYKTDIANERVEINDNLKETLPTYSDLINHLNGLFRQAKWRDYIINYLLIHYGVRNQDLNLIITREKAAKKNGIDNFLLVQSKNIIYIRNNYKTAKIYGSKSHRINNKDFFYAVKQLGVGYLLGSDKQHIGNFIQDRTLNKIGEGNIFKILVENSTKSGLTKLYENRGTSVSTIIESYSI